MIDERRRLEANVRKMYVFNVFVHISFLMAIAVPFFNALGLNTAEIFLLQSVFSVSTVLLEIPTGFIGDKVGRKNSMVMGTLIVLIGFFIYAFMKPGAYSFYFLALAEFILALGYSFKSGSNAALMYDTLLSLGKEKDFMKYWGKFRAIGRGAAGIAAILAGFFASIDIFLPVKMQLPFFFIAFVVALSFYEPPRHKLDHKESSRQQMKKIVLYSLHGHKEIKWLIIYAALISSGTLAMTWFFQPFLQHVHAPLWTFGILRSAVNFSVMVFSYYGHAYESYLGKRKSLISLVVLLALAYFIMGVFPYRWAVVVIFLFQFVRSVQDIIIADYINKLVESRMRATVLSVQSLVFRAIFAAFGPLLGRFADVLSLPTALLLSGGIFGFFGAIALRALARHRAL